MPTRCQACWNLAALGAKAIYLRADLSDLAGHAGDGRTVLAQFGRVDCLVNNAGIGIVVRGDFLDLDAENFDTIIGTNLRGTMFFTQAVVRRCWQAAPIGTSLDRHQHHLGLG
jgi:3-oxoacyl-[acyl-carrier protein] reductase